MKKAEMSVGVIVAIGLVVVGIIWALNTYGNPFQTATVDKQVKDTITTKELTSCSGIASVNALYDDKNYYQVGTDPGTQLTVTSPIRKLVSDDATSTTVPVLSSIKGLAGNNNGAPNASYFAEEVAFDTTCADVPIQTRLRASGAPTITAIQDDGITKFVNSTGMETVAASSSYVAEFSLRSPSQQCSARYGAIFACQYDATYVSKVERNGGPITPDNTAVFLPHTTLGAATYDQWTTFKWDDGDGMLCDGDKTDFSLKYTTTSSTDGNNGASINCTWMGIQKDLDADTFALITSIYDEDNNAIYEANTDVATYTTT